MDTTIFNEDLITIKSKGRIGGKALLLTLSDNYFGVTYVIDKTEMIIGRSKECDCVIEDDLISREHCRISLDGDNHFTIEDLSSTNSSLVNSKQLKKKSALYYGDKITLGTTVLRFFREELH